MIEIKSRYTGEVISSADVETMKEAAEKTHNDGADLQGADLYGAYLQGAYLDKEPDVLLLGNGVFQITPIGSRAATMVAFNTNKGFFIKTGCFFGEIGKFAEAVQSKHSGNKYGKEYLAAIEFVKIHFSEDK